MAQTIVATLCYVDNGEGYLLLHRHKKAHDIHHGKWIGVGGKAEPGETPLECVKREVLEETGLTIVSPVMRGTILFPLFDGRSDWLVFVYTASEFTGELIDCAEGTLEWVCYDQVLTKPTWPGDALFLEWLLQGKSGFDAKIVYENGQLVESLVSFVM